MYKRDFSAPTLEDHFNKTILPKVMQVSCFLSCMSLRCRLHVVASTVLKECHYSRIFTSDQLSLLGLIIKSTFLKIVCMMMWDFKLLTHLCAIWWEKEILMSTRTLRRLI